MAWTTKMKANLLFVAVALLAFFWFVWEPAPEPHKQNQMVDGCVMQKSGGTWIRTCG